MKDEPISNWRMFWLIMFLLFNFFGPMFLDKDPDCEPEYSNMGDGC